MRKKLYEKIDLEKLDDSTYLLDILMQIENVLDSLDIYVYLNWFDGEIVRGPIIRRHWISVSLLYPHDKMPDPRAALRLLKHGIHVEFDQIKQQVAGDAIHVDHEPTEPTSWMVNLSIPRRLIDQIDEADFEEYDDEVDTEDVTAAKDSGLDDESTYQADEQAPQFDQEPDQQAPQ